MNQIPNIEETHNTREVGERVYEFYDKHSQYTSIEDAEAACDWLRTTLTQDRAALHTSLVAAVEGSKLTKEDYEKSDFATYSAFCAHMNTHNATVNKVLTIINNIFKE